MDRQEKYVLEKEALLLTHIHIYIFSFSLYIYFYIYFVFFLLSFYSLFHSFFPILAHTHSTIHSLACKLSQIYTFIIWKYAKLYLYIYCIYIKVHGLSIRSNSQCIFSAVNRRTISFLRCRRHDRRDTRDG